MRGRIGTRADTRQYVIMVIASTPPATAVSRRNDAINVGAGPERHGRHELDVAAADPIERKEKEADRENRERDKNAAEPVNGTAGREDIDRIKPDQRQNQPIGNEEIEKIFAGGREKDRAGC